MKTLLFLFAASWAWPQGPAAPEPPAAGAPSPTASVKDTAGVRLREVWIKAKQGYPGALLISISGKTGASGTILCNPDAPFQDGWRYTFYSPKKDAYLMMAECAGSIAGPLVALTERESAHGFDISGRFIDSEGVMSALAKEGVSLDPADHKGGGRRPFALTLYRMEDEAHPENPLVWKVSIGEDTYLMDGNRAGKFPAPSMAAAVGGSGVALSSAAAAKRILDKRPNRSQGIYTVRKDFGGVMQYAQSHYPGARLMSIEGFADSWGSCPCTGGGDGWYFYFYHPKGKDYKTVVACNGSIGPGPTQYIPVDMNLHQPIDGAGLFIDSDAVMDAALVNRPNIMNEGMGKRYTRHGEILLLNYRTPPILSGQFKVTLIWQVKVGTTLFKLDAMNGKVIDISE